MFDVSIEGVTRLDDFDIVAAVGHDVGTMRAWTVTSDGSINIDFAHIVENPLINGIEIIKPSSGPPPPAGELQRRWYDGATVGATESAPNGGIDWSTVRGGVVIDGELFYGTADGNFQRRTFDGSTFGPNVVIDPYNDPKWSNVDTGSGQTYRGRKPGFYSELNAVVGLAYADGKLYYTKSGSSTIFFRRFSPESGIVSGEQYQVPGSFPNVGGIFFAQGKLWFADRSNGNLSNITWSGGAPSGSPTVVSGPGIDGNDWRARAVFLGPGPAGGGTNQSPTADFTASCSDLTCLVDGRASTDPDGPVASHSWNFGDDQGGSGSQTSHAYATAGTYTITLTVTDDRGATASTTRTVTVAPPASGTVQFIGTAKSTATTTQASVAVPASVQAGDTLLLFVGVNSLTPTTSAPTGTGPWQQEHSQDSFSMRTILHSRIAGSSDAGGQVVVGLSAIAKVDLQLAVYRGTSTTDPVAAVASSADASTSTHTTPLVTVPAVGSWAVSYWSDKSSSTTDWTPSAGVVPRSEQIGSGSGYLTSLVADSGAAVPTGSYGGRVATTDQTSSRGTNFTVLIAPSG